MIIMAIVAAIASVVLNYTKLGRNMYGIGGNVNAAIVEGINVKKIQMIGFLISGLLAGFTGFLLASRLGAAHPTAGSPFLMGAFASVFWE